MQYQQPKFHPEGMASFIAAIVATGDVETITTKVAIPTDEAYRQAVDVRRSQVLRLARAYYKVNNQDYDGTRDGWQSRAPRNGLQNLARLDRANLRP